MNSLKRLALLGFVGVGLACSAAAQTQPPVKGMIWKATADGFTMYLVGSVHLGVKEMYPLPQAFEDAFNQATDLIEEIDFTDLHSAQTQALALKAVVYPEDDTLTRHISPATLDLVKQYATQKKLKWENLCRLRPWALAYTVPFFSAMANPPKTAPVPGIDEYFGRKAVQIHKKVVGVETADFQLKILADMASDAQEKFLTATLNAALKPNDPNSPNAMLIIQNYWVAGDADGLNTYIEKGLSDFPADYVQHIIYDRNAHMAEVAERYAKYKKPCLLVVGAAHLLGPKGIVKLLQEKGFTVSQMTTPDAQSVKS